MVPAALGIGIGLAGAFGVTRLLTSMLVGVEPTDGLTFVSVAALLAVVAAVACYVPASGHGNSHTFITHEFVAALAEGREPAVDLYEALAMTVPGIVAMDSARKDGEQLKVPNFDKRPA